MSDDIKIVITEVEPINVIVAEAEPINILVEGYEVKRLIDLVDGPGVWENDKFLKSTASGWVWVSLPGGGDMLKEIYDTDLDNIVDTVNTVDGGDF